MNLPFFIFKRIATEKNEHFSSLITKICTIAISIGLAVMIITTAFVNGFQEVISQKVYNLFGQIIVSAEGDNKAGLNNEPLTLDTSITAILLQNKNVKTINKTALLPCIIKTKDNFEGTVLKGITAASSFSEVEQYILSNDKPNIKKLLQLNSTTISNQIIISQTQADRLNLKTNDYCWLYFMGNSSGNIKIRKVQVAAIFNSGLEDFDKSYSFVDFNLIQKINNWTTNQYGLLELTMQHNNDIDSLANQLNEQLPQKTFATSIRKIRPQIFDWLELQNINKLVILSIMLVISLINIITCLLILILERTSMIGLLKAMGASNISLQQIFLFQTGNILLKGLFWGNIVGIFVCWAQWYFNIIKVPEATYFLKVLPVSLHLTHILLINLVFIITSFFFLLLPSYYIGGISPIKAIKFK